jgi:GNAT superfamily N-acetyltransferase
MTASPHPIESQDSPTPVVIRRAVPADAQACGKICYDAFLTIATKHGFPADIPSAEHATGFLTRLFGHPRIFCVVAEQDGKIVGSNCMDERTAIAGIGPITIDPTTQDRSVGRRLMKAALDRAEEQRFTGVRLVQAGYHMRSLSLYAKLGFVVREPLACMFGSSGRQETPGYRVRPALMADLSVCNSIAFRIHGHDRGAELAESIQSGAALVVESRGRITAYTTSVSLFGHSVAESNEDMRALISGAPAIPPPGILVPMRNASLFRWCLDRGMRTIEPMNLMTIGLYNEPAGAYLPSVLF